MLNIWLGLDYPKKFEYHSAKYFDTIYKLGWINDKYNQKMIHDIDNGTKVIHDYALYNPIIGGISPLQLSGGVKTAILIREIENVVFNANACGDNCFKWIFDFCNTLERTIVLSYVPNLKDIANFNVNILNINKVITDKSDFSEIGYGILIPKDEEIYYPENEDIMIKNYIKGLLNEYNFKIT